MKRITAFLISIILILSIIIPIKLYAKNGIASTKILFYDGTLITNKKNVTISIAGNAREITKAQVKQANSNIEEILNSEGTALADTDKVGTGDKVKIGTTEFAVILYGDANGDGKSSETDDLMAIVNHYLESKKAEADQDKSKILTDEKFIAADIANKKEDKILDIEDISKMINIYLEKATDIVEKEPSGNVNEINYKLKEDNSPTLLSSVNIGDKVNYTSSSVAASNWIVCGKDDTNVFIMPEASRIAAGNKAFYDAYIKAYEDKITTALYDGTNASVFESANPTLVSSDAWSEFKKALNTDYAKAVRLPKYMATRTVRNDDDTKEIYSKNFNSEFACTYVKTTDNVSQDMCTSENAGLYWYDDDGIEISGKTADLRPVVVLKEGLKTSGKDTNGIWQINNVTSGKVETNQEEIKKGKLSGLAQVGDLVNYPVTYETAEGESWLGENDANSPAWRVLYKDASKIELVSNSTCFTVNLNEYNNKYSQLCTDIKNNFKSFSSKNDTKYGNNAYIDTKYANSSRAFNESDLKRSLGITGNVSDWTTYAKNVEDNDLLNIKQMYGLWTYTSDSREYILGINCGGGSSGRNIYNMCNFKFGVRAVIELKSGIETTGKDANGAWKI